MNCTVEYEDAVRIIAYYKYFDGDVESWKDAWYSLWQYQMTWGYAYQAELIDSSEGVFVSMLVDQEEKERLLQFMKREGYKNIITCEEIKGCVFDDEPECFVYSAW